MFLHVPAIKPGTTCKFPRPYKGPFHIVKLIDDVVVQIINDNGDMQPVHADRLKKTTVCDTADIAETTNLSAEEEAVPNQDYSSTVEFFDVPVPAPVPVVYCYNLRNRQGVNRPQQYR